MTSLTAVDRRQGIIYWSEKKKKKRQPVNQRKRTPHTVRADNYKGQDNEVLEASEKIYQETSNAWRTRKIICLFPGYTARRGEKPLRLDSL